MVKRPQDDSHLARKAKKGDKRAFQELVSRYQPKLTAYLRHLSLSREETEDLLQDVFVKAYRGLSRFDGRRRFSPWIYRIAHNEAVNHLKRRGKRRLVSWEDIAQTGQELGAVESQGETLEEEWMRKERQIQVHVALDRLSERDRSLLVLRFFLEKSYSEIAQIFDVPENTVASRLHRAKEKLAASMERRKRPRK